MKSVTVECSCGRKAQIPAETFGYTPQEFKVDKLAENLPKLQCRDCRSKANFVFNEREQLLFDLSNLSLCSSCEIPRGQRMYLKANSHWNLRIFRSFMPFSLLERS